MGNIHQYTKDGRLGGSQTWSESGGKEKNTRPNWELNPSCPDHIQLLYSLRHPGSINMMISIIMAINLP
jgi:hypothetical protein